MQIKMDKVFFSYEKKNKENNLALKNISTIFNDNSFTSLIGKTGSGKSTLIKCLNGLKIVDSGKIDYDFYLIDVSVKYKKNGKINTRLMKKQHNKKRKDISQLRKRVGVVFQFPDDQIFEDSVYKEVIYGPNNFNFDPELAKQSTIDALNLVGLDSTYYEKSPLILSGGEKRRVTIASVLSFNPDVLILDEPTASLDKKGKDDLISILTNIKRQGKSIIVSTHDMYFLLKLSDNVILLDDGKIIKACKPSDLFKDGDVVSNYNIKLPKCLDFAIKLNNNGFDIDLSKVKDTQSLVDEIIRCKN